MLPGPAQRRGWYRRAGTAPHADRLEARRSSRKTRLAALGTAVTKISHDLRNMLSAASLVSESLTASGDPSTRKVASQAAGFDRSAPPICAGKRSPTRVRGASRSAWRLFALHDLVDACQADLDGVALRQTEGSAIGPTRCRRTSWSTPTERILGRVFVNLGSNAFPSRCRAGRGGRPDRTWRANHGLTCLMMGRACRPGRGQTCSSHLPGRPGRAEPGSVWQSRARSWSDMAATSRWYRPANRERCSACACRHIVRRRHQSAERSPTKDSARTDARRGSRFLSRIAWCGQLGADRCLRISPTSGR